MVSLLGSRDELLHVIEGAFGADIHVRGNEITVTGSPEETALVARLFEALRIEFIRVRENIRPPVARRAAWVVVWAAWVAWATWTSDLIWRGQIRRTGLRVRTKLARSVTPFP